MAYGMGIEWSTYTYVIGIEWYTHGIGLANLRPIKLSAYYFL